MPCEVIDIPKDYIANAIRNHKVIPYIHPGMTYRQIAQTIRNISPVIDNEFALMEDAKEYVPFTPDLERSKIQRLKVGVDKDNLFDQRVSEKNNPRGKSKPQDENLSTKTGNLLHAALNEIAEAMYNGTSNSDVMLKYMSLGISKEVYSKLTGIVETMFKEAEAHQNMINKQLGTNDKFELLLEQRIASGPRSLAGKLDVLFLFSNKTAHIYDYKTYKDKEYDALANQYSGQLTDYKRILKEEYGVEEVTKTLIIPIQVKFSKISADGLSGTIKNIKTFHSEDENILVQAINGKYDKLGIEGLDQFLKTQYDQIRKLTDRVRLEKRAEVRDRLIVELADLKNAMNKFINSARFDEIAQHISKIVIPQIETQLKKGDFDNMEPREALDLINQYISSLKDYAATLDSFNVDSLQADLGLKADAEQLANITNDLNTRVKGLLVRLSDINKKITLNGVEEHYFETGTNNLTPLKPIGVIDRLFSRLSSLDHPIFKQFYKRSRESSEAKQIELRQFLDNMTTLQNKVENKLKSLGLNFKDVFIETYRVNKDTPQVKTVSNYLHDLSQEGRDLINELWKEAKETKKSKDLVGDNPKAPYEFKEEKFRENYEKRLAKFKLNAELRHGNNTEQIQKDIVNWELDNDIIRFDSAFFKNPNASKKWIRVKSEYAGKFKNPKLAFIESVPEFKDWLDFTEDSNNQFREMLGLNFGELPPNFYPNVRKDMMERFLENPSSIGNLWGSFLESLQIREDDTFMGAYANGEAEKEVPKFFISPLKDEEKSYNYGNSLALFAKMAINYKHATELEVHAKALRNALEESRGELKINADGKVVFDYSGDKVTKSSAQLVDLFNKHVDYLVYGITTQEKGINTKIGNTTVNSTKILKMTMKWARLAALGLKISTAAGDFAASRISINAIKKKGSYFTEDQFNQSVKDRVGGTRRKWLAVTRMLDATNEDLVNRVSGKEYMKGIRKIVDDRFLYSPFRIGDQFHKDDMAYAMSMNYVLDADNQLRRKTEGDTRPSLYDSLDPEAFEDKELPPIKGKTMEESMKILESFRTITKHAFTRVTGTMSEDNIYAAQTSLMWQNLMMFKSWMPGIMGERFGKITYDSITDTLDMPRYQAVKLWFTDDGQRQLKKIASRGLQLGVDIATYGLAKKALYKDGLRVSKLDTLQYTRWKFENPVAAENVTIEEFQRMQEGQLKATIFELRAILSMFAVLLFLGSDDEDDFYSHKNNYGMRQANKILSKAMSELTYFYNPASIGDLLSRPVGLLSFGTTIIQAFNNGLDEGRDVLVGNNNTGEDLQDRTPPGYYTSKLLVGFNGLRSVFDMVYEQDKTIR